MVSGTPILRLVELSKHFGSFRAVDNLSLDIHDGELFTVVGPSGSGKTTLLRMLAGMERPSAGDILLRGERINDIPANRIPYGEDDAGTIFRRWRSGGDYLGLVALPGGGFQALWADSRTGVFQLWTAPIEVKQAE